MINIVILGYYGPHGQQLEAAIRATLDSEAIPYQLTIENDYDIIRSRYGVLSTPALVINKRVYCASRIPCRDELLSWAMQEADSSLTPR